MQWNLPSLKKITVFVLLFLSSVTIANAQLLTAASYPFVASSSTFNYLSGGTPVTFANWDDGYSTIPIGFTFTFCGVNYTTVSIHTNGYLAFGSNTCVTYPSSQASLSSCTAPCVMGAWHDASGNATASACSYMTSGTAPNRTLTVEMKSWGSFSFATLGGYISYQYILYEGGPIEVLYKQEGTTGGFSSNCTIGIAKSSTDWQTLNNTTATPVSSSTVYTIGLGGQRPATGQSYLWGIIPCTDTPKYNITEPYQVCPNIPFNITLAGTSLISGLTFAWQYSTNGTSWSNFVGAGTGTNTITDAITSPRYYRCKITCINSNISYTTPPWYVNIAPFQYCYCNTSKAATGPGLDIGNLKIMRIPKSGIGGDTIVNNGVGTPLTGNTNAKNTYTSFQYTVPPVVMYRDSQYRVNVTQINSNSSPTAGNAVVLIDYNRDGEYDTVTERVLNKVISNPLGFEADTFIVPSTVEIGLTGMRVIIRSGSIPEPCGGYADGETEDYLVDLRYEPCTGPANPGAAQGDTAVCFGYDYIVTDTTFERKKSDLSWAWQTSADNILWFNTPNSAGKDTLMRIFTGQPLYYRMRVACAATKDTNYSTPVFVNQKTAYKCYCYSQAVGGKLMDSSDIGGFTLAGYANSDGGTHLDNPKAFRKRTDYTDESPIVLNVDSIYQITTFHTMRGAEHADAKITIFMDFNNDHDYDIPSERVFTGYTSVGNFTLVDNLTVPQLAIMNVPTGMRVILNNDIAPNISSDEACGPYTSGETEDYMVMFRKSFPTTVNDVGLIRNMSLYPNPTTGKFILLFNTTNSVKEVRIVITNVTGQQISDELYKHDGGQFTKELSLADQSKGVYFVEIQSEGEKIVRKIVVQ